MIDKNIEYLLRNSKPMVKDDPAFILRALRNMESVEGIKEEVDRQRRHGRAAVLAALGIGMIAGLFIAATAAFFPGATEALSQTLEDALDTIPYSWKLFVLTIAILAVTLSLVVPPGRKGHHSQTLYTFGKPADD